MTVPQSTIEKPLTAIDYIARLQECVTAAHVRRYAEACPEGIKADERFAKAVASRLAALA